MRIINKNLLKRKHLRNFSIQNIKYYTLNVAMRIKTTSELNVKMMDTNEWKKSKNIKNKFKKTRKNQLKVDMDE